MKDAEAGLFDELRFAGSGQIEEFAKTRLLPLLEPPNKVDNPACVPGKWFGGRILPLGASHVMETLAQQVQSDFLEPGALRTSMEIYQREGGDLYWFLFLKAGELYGIENMRNVEGYRRLSNTVIALADLALFAPLGPVYGRLRREGSTWEDVNLAMRYIDVGGRKPCDALYQSSFVSRQI